MKVVSFNQSSVVVERGEVFIGTHTQPTMRIDGEHFLSPSDTIWANPKSKYVLNNQDQSQVIENDCATCVVRESGTNNLSVVTLDPTISIDVNDLSNSQFTASDIAIIKAHAVPPEIHDVQERQTDVDSGEENTKPQEEVVETASSGFITVDYDNAQILSEAGHDSHGYVTEDEQDDLYGFGDDTNSNGDLTVITALGGENAFISLTEGDKQPENSTDITYPVNAEASATIEAGELPLDPSTFTFELDFLNSVLSELNQEITSSGQALSFVFDPQANAIVGTLNGQTYLTIDLDVTQSANGIDVDITASITVNNALDHYASGDNSGFVSNQDDQIIINLEVQGQDTGGNELDSPAVVAVIVNDGVDQVFGTDAGIGIDETDDLGATITGQIPLDVGSDNIASVNFDQIQTTFENVTSNGNPTTVNVVDNILTLVDSNGDVLLTVTVETDGSYSAVVSGSIDQLNTETSHFELSVLAVDADGDQATGMIVIDITDGQDLTIIDENIEFNDDDADSTNPATVTNNVSFDLGADDFNADGLLFLPVNANTGLTSNGHDVIAEVSTDGTIITYTDSITGEKVLVVTITDPETGEYQAQLYAPFDQDNANGDKIAIEIGVTATDTDGDTANAKIIVTVEDGQNPIIGNDNIEFNDDDANSINPAIETGNVSFESGVDDFNADGITFSPVNANTGLTSNGHAVLAEVSTDGTVITYTDSITNETVLVVTITDPETGAYQAELYEPFDQDNANGDKIAIEIGVTATDTDGDTANGNIVVTVEDGHNPTIDNISITLSDNDADPINPGIVTGNVSFDLGVDDFNADGILFLPVNANTGLTSNNHDVTASLSADGTTITYTDSVTDKPVLVLTINPETGEYQAELYQPFDQESNNVVGFEVGVTATDTDGDTVESTINVSITDGDDPIGSGDATFTIEEGGADGLEDNNFVDNAYPSDANDLSISGSFIIKATSDALEPSKLMIDSSMYSSLVSTIESFKSDGSAIKVDEKLLNVDEDGVITITATDENGNTVFTIVLTPTQQENGDVEVTVDVEQLRSLDHMDLNDDQLNLTIPVQIQDSDGDSLSNGPIDININFQDGLDPILTDADFYIHEGGQFYNKLGPESSTNLPGGVPLGNDTYPIEYTGNLGTYIGSDKVESFEFSLTDDQETVISRFSSGNVHLACEVIDNVLYVYTPEFEGASYADSGPENRVFTIELVLDDHLNNTILTQYKPLDHDDTGELSMKVNVTATDHDGDSETGPINITFYDNISFQIAEASGQEEDGQGTLWGNDLDQFDNLNGDQNYASEGIKVSMQLSLGDIDRGENLDFSSVVITPEAGAHGIFYYINASGNPTELRPEADGSFKVPDTLITGPDSDQVITFDDIYFVPNEDYSSDAIKFDVTATVNTDGNPVYVTGDLDIAVTGVADIPEWNSSINTTEYTGSEDTAIAIDGLSASLNDNDGSEALYYLVQIADGSEGVFNGVGLEEIGNTGIYRIAASDIGSLTVTPTDGFSGNIYINAWAQSEETGLHADGKQFAQTDIPLEVVVKVEAVADEPILSVSRVTSLEDTAIDLQPLVDLDHVSDSTDGSETLYIRFSDLPEGGILQFSDGTPVTMQADGSFEIAYEDLSELQYLPAPESSGDYTLTVEGIVKDKSDFDDATTSVDEFITDSKVINIEVVGVPDTPDLSSENGNDWSTITDISDGSITGVEITVDEDSTVNVDFDLISGEIGNALQGDNSETISVVISGIPEGTVISNNGNELELVFVDYDKEGNPEYQVKLDNVGHTYNLNNLTVTPPVNTTEDIYLNANVVVTEQDGGYAEFDKDIVIHIEPKIDAIDYTNHSEGIEDNLVTLNWLPTLNDSQEHVSNLTLKIPNGTNLSGYTFYIEEADGHQIPVTFTNDGTLNLDQYVDALQNEGAEIKVALPENSDSDFSLTSEVVIQQVDADDSSTVVSEIVNGTLNVDIQASVEEVGDPYDQTAPSSSGQFVITNGQDSDNDGVIDKLTNIVSDGNGLIDLSQSGAGYIAYAENDLSSDEVIVGMILDFSDTALAPGEHFTVEGAVNNGDGTWTVLSDNLNDIQIQAPSGFSGSVTVNIIAKVQDLGDNSEGDVSEEVIRKGDIELVFNHTAGQGTEPEIAAEITAQNLTVTGTEDGVIDLGSQLASSVSASTQDVTGDGNSEIPNDLLTVVIDANNLPEGTVINGAEYNFNTNEYSFAATLNNDGSVDLTGLELVPPADYAGDFQLDIDYVITDITSGDTNVESQTVVIEVAPVADDGSDLANGINTPTFDINVVSSAGLNQDYQPIDESTDTTEVIYNDVAYEDAVITLDLSVSTGDTLNTVEGGLETITNIEITVNPSQGYFIDGNGDLVSSLSVDSSDLSDVQFVPVTNYNGSVDISITGDITDVADYDLSGNTDTDNSSFSTTASFDVVAVNDGIQLIQGNISGDEDTAIALTGAEVSLQELDGSEEIVSVVLTNVPDGFLVDGATNAGGGEWSISIPTGSTSVDLSDVSIIPPRDFSGSFDINVVVNTREESLDTIAKFTDSITIEVNPVGDVIDNNIVYTVEGTENEDIILKLDLSSVDNELSGSATASNVTENSPEQIQITVSNVPVDMGASLSLPQDALDAGTTILDNGDGTFTIQTTDSGVLDSLIFNPGNANNTNWDGELDLVIASIDNGATADVSNQTTATINVDVEPMNDAPENIGTDDTFTAIAGEVTTITSLSISDDKDLNHNTTYDPDNSEPYTVTLSAENGVLSIPASYTGSVIIDVTTGGQLVLTGSIDNINQLLNDGIELNTDSDYVGDVNITMTTSDSGNIGDGVALTDEDIIVVNVASANRAAVDNNVENISRILSPLPTHNRTVPTYSATAAQLALIPLLALLSDKVEASELLQVELGNLGLANVVDANGQAIGELQDDGSVVLSAQDLQNAYIDGLPQGEHAIDVALTEQVDDELATSQAVIDVVITPENTDEQSEHSSSHIDDLGTLLVDGGDSSEIIGTDGDDILVGGLGADILTGGAGNDELWGGEYLGSGDGESDTFVWHAQDIGTTATPAVDVIKDFELDIDKIDIRDLFSDGDSEGVQMDDMLSGLTASEEDGNINLSVTSESGGEQVIVLDNISTDTLGLDSSASSSDIISNLFDHHNTFVVDA